MVGRVVVAGMLAATVAVPVFAGPNDTPGVDRREQRQQTRIQEGVASGALTPREAAKLEAEQARIRAKEQAMKADGVVTKQERKELQRDLNRSSKHIAKEKHDKQRAK